MKSQKRASHTAATGGHRGEQADGALGFKGAPSLLGHRQLDELRFVASEADNAPIRTRQSTHHTAGGVQMLDKLSVAASL